jgi:hypothetical protein
MSSINKTLQSAYKEHGNMHFGGAVVTVRENSKKIVKIVSEEEADARELKYEKPYFFMSDELEKDITKENYMDNLRHAVCTRNGSIYDYITGCEYDTIDDWADDCNGTVDDVMYGTNHTWRKSVSVAVPLSDLVDWIEGQDYVKASREEEEEFWKCKKHGCCASISPDAWIYRGTKELAREEKAEFEKSGRHVHETDDDDEEEEEEEDQEEEDEEEEYDDMPPLVSVTNNVTFQAQDPKNNVGFTMLDFMKLFLLGMIGCFAYKYYETYKHRPHHFLSASF